MDLVKLDGYIAGELYSLSALSGTLSTPPVYETARCDTTANWDAMLDYVPPLGEILVYTDYTYRLGETGNIEYIPGVKIGDGRAYAVDLPFIAGTESQLLLSSLETHLDDSSIHVTATDKENWNSKVSVSAFGENLIFSL